MGEDGWAFRDGPGNLADDVNEAAYLREVYKLAKPDYTGRVSVPVLWDKHTRTIVNNESAEIIRMFNGVFDALPATTALDLYPQALRAEIDAINERVYHDVNNGVYAAGFATAQAPYEKAFDTLFETLDWLDDRLAGSRYLCGTQVTEADWRLFTTLLRFDPVYVGYFKCNRKRIAEYANLSGYLRELHQWPGVAATCNLEHIKRHYYESHETINPTGIVPRGTALDLDAPHGRAHL
jgi:putative glutathione S-transferase